VIQACDEEDRHAKGKVLGAQDLELLWSESLRDSNSKLLILSRDSGMEDLHDRCEKSGKAR